MASSVKPQGNRDLRIDFLRGVFILSLGGSHFGWLAGIAGYSYWLRFYDIQPFGFSSPAEFFVFFSGYVMSLVLIRKYKDTGFFLTFARSLHRSWTLYIFNIFTFVVAIVVVGLLVSSAGPLAETIGLPRFLADPVGFCIRFMTFRDNLAFFEILRNYIFFLPLVAIFIYLSQIGAYVPLAISVAVWLVNLIWLRHLVPWTTFNPFGWQLIFFLGATFAKVRPLTEWKTDHRTRHLLVCFVLIILCFVLKEVTFPEVAAKDFPFAEKRDIGPLRLAHFFLLLWTSLLVVPASEVLGRIKLTRSVVKVGQNSLECFCLSSILVYAGAGIISHHSESVALYWVVVVGVLALLLAGAELFSWFKAEPWNKRRG